MLAQQINKKDEEIKKLIRELEEARASLTEEQVSIKDLETVQEFIPVWKEHFEKAEYEKKKVLLSLLIDQIIVSRDTLEVHFGIFVDEFQAWISGVHKSVSWESA